jgi:hypothetical protein
MSGFKIRIWLGLLVLAFLAIPVWVTWHPKTETPAVSIKLLGYTNDETGARLAVFGVTNVGGSEIDVYGPHVTDQDTTQPPIWTYGSARLTGGAGASFTIRAPTNAAPWMLEMWAIPDVGWFGKFNRLVTMQARHMPYAFHSIWVTNTP